MLVLTVLLGSLLLQPAPAQSNNVTETDSCDVSLDGPWSELLEDWATTPVQSFRQGRILSIPQNKNYYITDRIDLVPPPPGQMPSHGHHPPYTSQGVHGPPQYTTSGSHGPQSYTSSGGHGPPSYTASNGNGSPSYTASGSHGSPAYSPSGNHGPPHMTSQVHGPPASVPTGTPPGPQPYSEWQGPPPPPGSGKIVNRPPKPYKDQFKPSYDYPPQGPNQALSHAPPKPANPVDRVDEQPPRRQVSETDLYLLSAIEKLVFRVDLMEKRLRKMEESMHQILVPQDPKEEPCKANFTRVRGICYHFSTESADWKTASITCRKMKSHLLEIDTEQERNIMFSALLADKRNRGANWWTGGLNPGLLWIWSYSAAPIVRNSTTASPADPPAVTIGGDGRCLALLHDGPANTYVYRGEDCALRHRFVCEKEEDKAKLSNDIERVSRKLRITAADLQEKATAAAAAAALSSRGRRRAKIAWDEKLIS